VKTLNVLALSSWYPNHANPYLGNFVQRHCKAIATIHNVWVIFIAAVNDKSEERIEKHQSANLTEIIIYQRPGKNDLLKYRQRQKMLLQSAREIGVDFDIIHGHVLFPSAPLFAYISKKLGIPWVFSEHWSGFHERFRPAINPFKWKLILKASKTAKMGFPVSANLASAIKKVLPKSELLCIPNVVEDVFFETNKSDSHRDPIRFLHVSTLVEEYKNFHGTLEAFSALVESKQSFELVVVTDGDASQAKTWVEELNLSQHITFTGPMSSAEIAEEMTVSDALILFSNTENQPCVVLEALSTGLPVIASDVGDIPNLVTDGKGLTVPPRDVNALAESLISFTKNRSQYKSEQVAEGTREKFSKDAVARAYSNAYKKVLNG